jgi:hypothetical protein
MSLVEYLSFVRDAGGFLHTPLEPMANLCFRRANVLVPSHAADVRGVVRYVEVANYAEGKGASLQTGRGVFSRDGP